MILIDERDHPDGPASRNNFGDTFRKVRRLRGWTQARTAQHLGVNPNSVSRWEQHGKWNRYPGWHAAVGLLVLLGGIEELRIRTH